MRGYGFVLLLALVSLVTFGSICSDESHGEVGESFEEGIFTFEVIGLDKVRVIGYAYGESGDLIIPESVTHVDEFGISATYIVTSIGEDLYFMDDSDYRITSIHIPASIVEIQAGALSFVQLESITVDSLNSTFETYGEILYNKSTKSIVRYCSGSATTVYEIPDWIIGLEAHSFRNSINLVEIKNLPDSMKAIEEFTFQGCSSLSKINYDLDKGQNILPDSILYIGNSAFAFCDGLVGISLPVSLVMIDSFAFSYSEGLKTIDIPAGIKYLGTHLFYATHSLEGITVSPDNDSYFSQDGVLFGKNGNSNTTTLIHYPSKKTDVKYTMPFNVNGISEGAFSNTVYLKEVVLNDLFVTIPKNSFSQAISLEKVTIPSTTILIGASAFSECSNLATIIGGESVVVIGSWAFSNTNLSSLFFPSGVKTIENNAFHGCMALEHITIPDTDTYLAEGVFQSCFNLKSITFEGTSTKLDTGTLSIGDEDHPVTLTVNYHDGLSIPSDVCYDGYTELDLVEIGKEPYPWENLIGVFVCILIVFGIFRLFKEV